MPKYGSFEGSLEGFQKGRYKRFYKGLGLKGPCAQTLYTSAQNYLYRDYFKAKYILFGYMEP